MINKKLTECEKLELALYLMYENQTDEYKAICKMAENNNIEWEEALNRYETPGGKLKN